MFARDELFFARQFINLGIVQRGIPMTRFIMRSSVSATIVVLCLCSMLFSAPDSIRTLPPPQTAIGKPLMQALMERKSSRIFDSQPVSMQDLSNLLWAGFGINRAEKGGRTAPSAMNRQEIDLYVALSEGMYLYDAKVNVLRLIAPADLRELTGTQGFAAAAPCNIVFVVDREREGGKGGRSWAEVDAAFISENIYLYCASEGLATVVRASVDKNALGEAMKLGKKQEIVFAQSVGYRKK
jgi:nitroreductase